LSVIFFAGTADSIHLRPDKPYYKMNKSFILVTAFVFATIFVHAQTSSGNMMVGGSIGFSSVAREGGSVNDASSFTFAPSFGYLSVTTSLSGQASRFPVAVRVPDRQRP
jgi:hypothetical protein